MKEKTIWRKQYWMFFLMLGFIEPTAIVGLSGREPIWNFVHNGFLVLRLFSICIAILIYIKEAQGDYLINGLLLWGIYIVGNDFLQENIGAIKTLWYVLSVLGFVIIIRHYSKINCLDRFLKVFCFIISIYIFVNLGLIIIMPAGVYRMSIYNRLGIGAAGHFLGYKTTHIYYFLPYFVAMFLSIIDSRKKAKWSMLIMSIFVLSTSIIVEASATTGITLLVIIMILLSDWFINIRNSFFMLVSLCVSLLLIMSNHLTVVVTFISGLFGKTATLSGRTTVWVKGVETFKSNPIWGTGWGSIPDNINYLQYHNKYLDSLCCGGIVLLIIFVVLMFGLCKRMEKKNALNNMAFKILLAGYGILYIVEASRTDILFWGAVAMCYYYNTSEQKGVDNYKAKKMKYMRIRWKK